MGNLCIQTTSGGERSVHLDCPNAQTDLGFHILMNARSMQTVSRLPYVGLLHILAFALTIVKSRVPHKYFSFAAIKFYLSTRCRYSDFKIRGCCLKRYNENIVNKAVKDTRLE